MKQFLVVLALAAASFAQITNGSQQTYGPTGVHWQTKSVVDVRDVAGVDCTGVADSSTALNTLFTTISNKKVIIPTGCELRVTTQLTIQGQESFIIQGQGERPGILGGPSISGCAGSAGPILYINRSGYWHLQGFGIYPKQNVARCPGGSSFTRSVDIANTGGGGFTTTEGIIDNMGFTTNVQGGAITNYMALNFVGAPNTEHMVVRNNWFNGQHSLNSYGIRGGGINSDNDLADGNIFAGFFQAIRQETGNWRIINNHFGENGNFSTYGVGGAAIYIRDCVSGPVYIAYNEESDGGPFINSGDDLSGSGCPQGINIIGNAIGVSDQSPTAFPVNIGAVGADYVLIGNQFIINPAISQYIIGSNSQTGGTINALGTLFEYGNNNKFPANSLGMVNATKPFQGGEYHSGLYPVSGPASLGPLSSSTISELMTYGNAKNTDAQPSPFRLFRFWSGTNYDDWAMQTIPTTGNSTLAFSHRDLPANNIPWFSFDGANPGITLSPLATPSTPSIQTRGSAGGTSYSYVQVAYGNAGHTIASAAATIATGNATLTTTNYNLILFAPLSGASKFCIWRTASGGTPSSTGKIGCTSAVQIASNSLSPNTMTFSDTGLAGDSSVAPTDNTTGQLTGLAATLATPALSLVSPLTVQVQTFDIIKAIAPTTNSQQLVFGACYSGSAPTAPGADGARQVACSSSGNVVINRSQAGNAAFINTVVQSQSQTAAGTGWKLFSGRAGVNADGTIGTGAEVYSVNGQGDISGLSLATTATNGGISGTEGTGAGVPAGANLDVMWPDSTAHRWKMNNNNGTSQNVTGSLDFQAVYNHSGTQQNTPHIVQDSCTLGTDCSVTLTGAAVYTSSTSYTCACVDAAAIQACRVNQTSGSAFAITGTGTDVIRYLCAGN